MWREVFLSKWEMYHYFSITVLPLKKLDKEHCIYASVQTETQTETSKMMEQILSQQ